MEGVDGPISAQAICEQLTILFILSPLSEQIKNRTMFHENHAPLHSTVTELIYSFNVPYLRLVFDVCKLLLYI